MTWWPDADGTGYNDGARLWPPYTYSRATSNQSGGGQYPYSKGTWVVGESGGCFTLTAPWAMGNVKVGIPVMNSIDGGNYTYYLLSNEPIPRGDTLYSRMVNGMACDVTSETDILKLRCGTAFWQGIWIPNYSGGAGETSLLNLSVLAIQ
jgi:hypothetical protein